MTNQHYPNNQPRITLHEFSALKKAFLAFVKTLPATSPLSIKLTRAIYGKKLKHMRNAGPNLRLIPDQDGWQVYWKSKLLTTTVPFPQPTTSHKPLWIMATGPSICDQDLAQLKNEIIIGLNGAIATCSEYGLSPTYYAITDRDFFENRMHLVRDALQSGAHCFFSFEGIARICQQAPNLLQNAKISLLETVNRYYMTSQLTDDQLRDQLRNNLTFDLPDYHTSKSGWSHNASLGVFTGNTIAYIACQIAQSLNFQTAHIIGMDLGSTKGKVRSYESGNDARPTSIDTDYDKYILPAFKLLAKQKLSTQFWNLSPTSRLPESVMPRKPFDQALTDIDVLQ